MTVIKKLVTLLRGSARELGESVVDANATRIYEQEIIDAKHSIEQARGDLTGVMAKEMQTARAIDKLKAEVARHEGLAVEALNKQHEPLALEVAEKVSALEQELEEQTRSHANYADQVVKLKELIRQAEQRIREHERELAIAKTTESVYRATRSISESIGASGSKLSNARESLTAAKALDDEIGHASLEKKLAAAGIGPSAERTRAVMDRIRARQGGGQAGDEGGTGGQP
jgi:phage shock protein A